MLTRCSPFIVTRLARRPLTTISSYSSRTSCKTQPFNKTCFRRSYASSASPAHQPATNGSGASAVSSLFPLERLVDELDRIAPRFHINAEDIEILPGPAQFYQALKEKISKAQRRVYLSTLYIGKTEHELIGTIRSALAQNPDLKVSFLTDALRGTREAPKPSCASLLAPLIAEFGPERVEVRLYHTPNLTGLRKRWIPKRINEGWGLQHMKLYGVDDEIVMSGYHVFRSAELTDYYAQVHDAVCSISFQVQPSDLEAGFESSWPKSNKGPSPLSDPKGYKSHASSLLGSILAGKISPTLSPTANGPDDDTVVYPLFQLTPLFKDSSYESSELPALHHVLRSLDAQPLKNSRVTFTAGYFNPTPQLTSLLLSNINHINTPEKSALPPSLTVIAASPWANGFYGSAGVSGMLPPAYTLLCRRFLEEVGRRGLDSRVQLLEWRRGTVSEPGGWTYHAKGLWMTLASSRNEFDFAQDYEPGPSICLVGSSNYTARSTTLDLEANALIVTRNPGLQRRLAAEEKWLGQYAKQVGIDEYTSTERRVGLHVRIAMWIVKVVGGAL